MKRYKIYNYLLSVGLTFCALFCNLSEAYSASITKTFKVGEGGDYKTLFAAIEAVHADYGSYSPRNITFNVVANTTETKQITLHNGDVFTIQASSSRKSINFDFESGNTYTRCIGMEGGSKLTIGGGAGYIIFRATKSTNMKAYSVPGSKVLIKLIGNAELTINSKAELAYGENVLWLNGENAIATMNDGIIHSATNGCVNITSGTFNLKGGYLCGHYYGGANAFVDVAGNPVLNIETFMNAVKSDVPKTGEILGALKTAYGLDSESAIPLLSGVYLHTANATFNMSGGSISGFCGNNQHQSVVTDIVTPVTGKYETVMLNNRVVAVRATEGTVNISGGKIFGNFTTVDGAALILSYGPFDKTVECYDKAVGTISGNAILAYNESQANGGAARIERQTTLNLEGGSINHNVSGRGETSGGGGGIRLVSSKLTMSGNAEIAYNNATGHDEKYNGGGIGAVWQESYGAQLAIVELNGGSIHHNVAEDCGGGIAATDKGNTGDNSGIRVTFNGVKIYANTAKSSGGGVYIGGGASINLDNNTSIYQNTAAVNGGGIYLGAIEGHIGSLETNKCAIYSNIAENGGGIYTEYSPVTVKAGTKIYDHTIVGNGGGVCLGNSSTFTMTGGEFYDNSAKLSGGAVAVLDGECSIYGGKVYSNSTDANGAGIYVNLDSKEKNVTVSGSDFFDNAAKGNGGAIAINGGSLTVTGGVIGENGNFNTAGLDGGAFYVSGGDATINGGSINYNQAERNGGGLCVVGGDIAVEGGNITLNRAKGNGEGGKGGGAVYSSGGVITLGDVEIAKNMSKEYGGAIYIEEGTINVTGDCKFTGNEASVGGRAILQNGVMNLSGQPIFDADQTVHFPSVASANGTAYTYRVITKVGEIGEATLIPITLDEGEIYLKRDVLVSTENASGSAAGQVVKADCQRFVVRGAESFITTYMADGLDAGSFSPKDVVELAGIAGIHIVRKGLQIGESAIYKVYDVTGDKSSAPELLYTVSVTGEADGDGKPLAKVERLIKGIVPGIDGKDIKVDEESWSWSYKREKTTVEPKDCEKSADIATATGHLGELASLIYTFDGAKKEDVHKHSEGIAVNTFDEYGVMSITVKVREWLDGGKHEIDFVK